MNIPPTPIGAAKPCDYPWVVAIVVSMAAFVEVINTSVANISVRFVAGNFGASLGEVTWVLTSHLVAGGIMIAMSGWLSSVLGRKRFYMICLAGFTVSSFLCGLAPSLAMLVLLRVFQGAAGGGLVPTSQAMLADKFRGASLGTAFAIYGIAIVAGPAIGPSLGGWITDNYSWRWIFFLNIPLGLLLLWLTHHFVREPLSNVPAIKKSDRARGVRADYIGLAFVVLAVGCIEIMLDKGEEYDWFKSSFINIVASLALIGLVGMIVWETRVARTPIVDIPLLANANLAIAMVLQFVVGLMLICPNLLIPWLARRVPEYGAASVRAAGLSGWLLAMLMMPIAGLLVRCVHPKNLIAIGLALLVPALYCVARIDMQISFKHLAIARAIQCIGLSLIFVALNTFAYGNLPPGKIDNGSAIMNLTRNLGGGVGISLALRL